METSGPSRSAAHSRSSKSRRSSTASGPKVRGHALEAACLLGNQVLNCVLYRGPMQAGVLLCADGPLSKDPPSSVNDIKLILSGKYVDNAKPLRGGLALLIKLLLQVACAIGAPPALDVDVAVRLHRHVAGLAVEGTWRQPVGLDMLAVVALPTPSQTISGTWAS